MTLGGVAVGLLTKFGAIGVGTGATKSPSVPPSSSVALLLAMGLAASAQAGCGGEAPDARMVRDDYILGGIESSLFIVGQAIVPIYETAEAACSDGPAGEYDACVRPWNRVIAALSTVYHDAAATRDAFAARDRDVLVPCIASGLSEAIAAVEAIPALDNEKVRTALAAARSFASMLPGECQVSS